MVCDSFFLVLVFLKIIFSGPAGMLQYIFGVIFFLNYFICFCRFKWYVIFFFWYRFFLKLFFSGPAGMLQYIFSAVFFFILLYLFL